MKTLPELLVPVGSPDKLGTALRYGADAVYLGGRALSLRAKTDGFPFPNCAPQWNWPMQAEQRCTSP